MLSWVHTQIQSLKKRMADLPTYQFADLVSKEAAQCVGILLRI